MMPRRRQRGRGAGSGRAAAAGEGAGDVIDPGRKADYVERLASKYMRNCKVESSTDSESDNNNEGFGNNVLALTFPVDVKTIDFQKLQFLDPYDGDSEDTIQSNSSECDLKCVIDDAQEPCTVRDDSMGMDCGMICGSDPQCEGSNLLSHSDPLEKIKIPWQNVDVSEKSGMVKATCSSDLSMDSGMVTEDTGVVSGCFFLVGLDSRVETSTSPVFPTSLTSEENSDFSMFEASLIKRKVALRNEGEKMRRKKPRVSEFME
ncbi:hypothetical protein GDO81_015441 [Engystomops pustulosus]|uniref:Uncharacterized protein n=2 Tax=Engystomops pustulosus TaxID=76066 RepID=A0AAV7AUA6_ENGPU|nr:hypothetical protein GDO81_015441 [Engystomops pustulosus]